jgi:hypothetical protein
MNKHDNAEVATVLHISYKEQQQYDPVVQNRSTVKKVKQSLYRP